VSTEWKDLAELARRAVVDIGAFEESNVGRAVERPDFHFIFEIRIESTDEPWLPSGLIWPFYREREYTVRVHVLDKKGQLCSDYIASSGTFQARHIFLVPFTPFYWPGRAERAARRSVFEALSAKLVVDRKGFL
jgi:hypothetical protein